MRKATWLVLVAVSYLPAGCKRAETPTPPGGEDPGKLAIRIDGSSTVFPLTDAVAREFRKQRPDVELTVGISGTGGGFQRFCAGQLEVTNASRPIKPREQGRCAAIGVSYVELPVAYDGIAVVVNPKNDWVTSLTTGDLRRIWEPAAEGRVKTWKDVRPEWPAEPLVLLGPGGESGTYDYFTQTIVGRALASRKDYEASEDDNVLVQGVTRSRGALAFFGLSYYEENRDRLKLVAIDDGDAGNGAGPIAPTVENVRAGTYQPLSRPVFVYVSVRALERAEVLEFARFYLQTVAKVAPTVHTIALPERAYALGATRLAARHSGSVFAAGDSTVGLSIKDLLAREAVAVTQR